MKFVCLVSAFLWVSGCENPEPAPQPPVGETCVAEIDPSESVYQCDGEELLWCVCDNYVDNQCPDQAGHWVVQDILCTCEEWLAGDCPVE
jgi:hypothetical protein